MRPLSDTPFSVLELAPMRDDDAGPGPALRRSLDLAPMLDAYRQRLSGDLPVMHRMWELWTYLAAGFDGAEPYLKRMRKAKNLSEYQAAVDALLREQPLVYSKEG